jgi:hypothetical protein
MQRSWLVKGYRMADSRYFDLRRSPVTYGQLIGIAIITAVGLGFGISSVVIAIIDRTYETYIWGLVAYSFAFAVLSGRFSTIMYRRRKSYLAAALSVVMDYEEHLETATRDDDDLLDEARGWQEYFVASGLTDIADRIHGAILRFEAKP